MANPQQVVKNQAVLDGKSVITTSILTTTVTFETEEQAKEFFDVHQTIIEKREIAKVVEEDLENKQRELHELEIKASLLLDAGSEDEECCGCGSSHCMD